MSASPEVDFDIAVVGGGIVGLALVQLLAQGVAQRGGKQRIVLLESNPPRPVPENAELDLRVSAIAPASRQVLRNSGAWDLLPAGRACAYEHMCVWQVEGAAYGARSISFAAAEIGTPDLGHIVENRALRNALWSQVAKHACVTVIEDRKLAQLSIASDAANLQLEGGDRLRTRLVVGADGARSWVREQLGVQFHEHSYRQQAIIAHLAAERPHAATAWQCFLPGGPVALLPLADGRLSLVWSCPEAEVEALQALSAAEFAVRLEAVFGPALGKLECTTDRVSFPLGSGRAAHYTGLRFALVGDAAHRIHPLAGQGVNLGLLDAAELAKQILQHLSLPAADCGDPLMLRRYERARKGDNRVTQGVMSAINALFSGSGRSVAGAGLELIDKFRPLKAHFAAYAMGKGRDLPPAAR